MGIEVQSYCEDDLSNDRVREWFALREIWIGVVIIHLEKLNQLERANYLRVSRPEHLS